MKVAVSASGQDLEAGVDPRFGRCANYLVVDTESLEFEVVANSAAMQGSGAGIGAAQLVAQTGAEAVVTGNVGPNAYQALSAGGIPVYTGASGTVRQAIDAFKAGQLQSAGGANVAAHSGVGGAGAGTAMGGGMAPGVGMGGGMGPGMGMGGGMGRGMGGGMGRGAGMGAQMGPGMMPGMGMGQNMPPMMLPEEMREQQLQMLNTQAQMLQQQLDLLNQQIQQLEENSAGEDT